MIKFIYEFYIFNLLHKNPKIVSIASEAAGSAAGTSLDMYLPVDLHSSFTSLGLDSLDRIELFVQVERDFNVELGEKRFFTV